MDIHLTTVAGSFVRVLPHMLNHYRELGITSFFVNVHLSHDRDVILEEAQEITNRFGCGIASVVVGDWQSNQVEMYARFRRQYPNDWFILADQDELQVYPHDLIEIIKECDRKGYDYINGCFVDRISADGGFPEVEQNRDVWSQFPLGGFVSYPMLRADPRKVVAAKGHVKLVGGQHYALSGISCPLGEYFIQVHHFKWVKDLVSRLARRAQILKDSNVPHWAESERFVSYFEKHGGRIDINDPLFGLTNCERDYKYWNDIRQKAINLLSSRSTAKKQVK